MNKFNTHSTKKSLKPLLTISAIATLLIAAMSLTTTPNANASFNFGLKSKDVNTGSIDTDSLFSCVGAAINCVNTNQNNNNEVVNNTAVVVPGPGPGPEPTPDNAACQQCLSLSLDATQQSNFGIQLGLAANAGGAAICDRLAQVDAATVTAALLAPEVGVTQAVVDAILACLILAGYTNLA
jgi:hypothetical protein